MKARRRDSIAAEERFRVILAAGGAILLDEYRGRKYRCRVRCSEGHVTTPQPQNILTAGRATCIVCAKRDRASAGERFLARLAEMGVTPLFDEYLGKDKPHLVRCPEGHLSRTLPSHVRKGGGVCGICARNDPEAAEKLFLERLAELGATPAYEQWLGVGRRHHVICADGHDCYPSPDSVRMGRGACRICAKQDPETAARDFRARLEALGATLLEGQEWRGANALYDVICAGGHRCRVRPGGIQQGHGPCRFCAGKEWDVFYVVAGGKGVKFGVTSGDGSNRLQAHRRDGYPVLLLMRDGLPGTAAQDAENAVRAQLAAAGEAPVRGREYFRPASLDLVLSFARTALDGYQAFAGSRSLPAGSM